MNILQLTLSSHLSTTKSCCMMYECISSHFKISLRAHITDKKRDFTIKWLYQLKKTNTNHVLLELAYFYLQYVYFSNYQ